MAIDSGRGFEGGEVGELGPSKGWYRMFSTLWDRLCDGDRVGLPDDVEGRFSGD